METLPYEIVAAIGDHLLPKYRCRLFMCCKLWQRECTWPQRWLFQWYEEITRVNKLIKTIKYDIVSDIDCEYGVYNVMSEIIKPNGNIVYAGNSINEDDFNMNRHYNIVYISSKRRTYEYENGEVTFTTDNYISAKEIFRSYRVKYMLYYVRKNDQYRCNIYLSIDNIIKYLNRADVVRLAIALGNVYVYELFMYSYGSKNAYFSHECKMKSDEYNDEEVL
jgi:hypothetical protein